MPKLTPPGDAPKGSPVSGCLLMVTLLLLVALLIGFSVCGQYR